MTHGLNPITAGYEGARHGDEAIKNQILDKIEYDLNGGCWLWAGSISPCGYGWARSGGRSISAHRASYAAFRGPVGPSWVLHKCDVRACCNPDHLFLGSHADNMADMARKGRGKFNPAKGEDHAAARLNDDTVRMIRSSPESSRKLAARLPVTASLIRRIRRGQAWAHVKPKSPKPNTPGEA